MHWANSCRSIKVLIHCRNGVEAWFFCKIEEEIAVHWPLAFWWVEWIRLVCTWNLGQAHCTIPILITQFFSHSQAHFRLLNLTLLTSWNFQEACVFVNYSGSGLYLKNKGVSLISQSRTQQWSVWVGLPSSPDDEHSWGAWFSSEKSKQESIDSFHPALDAH